MIDERFKDVPHSDIIKPNETIHIKSIFMFENHTTLFSFLCGCKFANCVCIFDNEKITIKPTSEDKAFLDLKLTIYMTLKNAPEIFDDYIRYLLNINEMQWEKSQTEVI